MKVLELRDHSGKTSAMINLGKSQVFSLEHEGVEFMWGGGRPDEDKNQAERSGWQNSEIIMFPIIGPAKSGRVIIDSAEYSMGQHGTARHLDFTLSDHTDNSATFVQAYHARQKVGGPGYTSDFPFDYQMVKTYSIGFSALTLTVKITNLSDRPMPFAVGWHPAFLIFSDRSREHFVRVISDMKSAPETHYIETIKAKSKSGSIVESSSEAEYFSPRGKILLKSDLGFVQLWSPEGQGLLCIEPISARPDPSYDGELAQKPGYKMLASHGTEEFSFRIEITSKA